MQVREHVLVCVAASREEVVLAVALWPTGLLYALPSQCSFNG